MKLNRQYKKKYFDNLNLFHDPKPFSKTSEPYFSNKHSSGESKIALTEKDEIMNKSSKVAKTLFNSYCTPVTESLDLFN